MRKRQPKGDRFSAYALDSWHGPHSAKPSLTPAESSALRLAGGKIVVEPKKVGGVEAMLAMAEELVEALRAELSIRSQDAA